MELGMERLRPMRKGTCRAAPHLSTFFKARNTLSLSLRACAGITRDAAGLSLSFRNPSAQKKEMVRLGRSRKRGGPLPPPGLSSFIPLTSACRARPFSRTRAIASLVDASRATMVGLPTMRKLCDMRKM